MVIKFNANVIKFIAKLIETYGNAATATLPS
jgi:hypothetical protein